MNPRRRTAAPGLWTTSPTPTAPAELTTIRLEGRLVLEPGREVTVRGLGRARYSGHLNGDGSIDVYWRGRCRSVMPDRVTKVHRTEKLR